MLHPYVAAALLSAAYTFNENGGVLGAVAGLAGVNAAGKSIEACRARLRAAIEAHIADAQRRGLELPLLYGVEPPLVPIRRERERAAAV